MISATQSSPVNAAIICASADSPTAISESDAITHGLVIKNKGTISTVRMGDKVSAIGRPNSKIPGYDALYKKFYPRAEYFLVGQNFVGGSKVDKTDRVSSNDNIFSFEITSTTSVLHSNVSQI